MESDFDAWFNQRVTIESHAGLAPHGANIYSDPKEHPAMIERKNKMIRTDNGRETVSSCQIFLPGTVDVTAKSRITLPDGSNPPILSVSESPDEDGSIHHKVVYT